MAASSQPHVLVARRIFPQVVERLRECFEVDDNPTDTILERSQLVERLQGKAGAFITASERIDAALLDACPDLRAVCNMAVGFNNIDVQACSARGVMATNTPGVLTETTADLGFALLMAAARRITEGERYLRQGRWTRWTYDMFIAPDVHGSTLGILGMGRIGQAIARRGALGFGMKVIYHNRTRLAPELEAPLAARWVDKTTLLRECDHLVLVLPYSDQTHHAIGAAELALMKPAATLTNIGRGGLVDEDALAAALQAGRLAAAGLDVFEGEPRINPKLLALPNAALTPHIGSASLRTRRAMADLAAANLIAALCGQRPPSLLNPEVFGLHSR